MFIGMAGLHGCLPQYAENYDTYDQAVDGLTQVHELSQRLMGTLKKSGYVELDLRKHGNEYCEITKAVDDMIDASFYKIDEPP